jgi:hypothetical protein
MFVMFALSRAIVPHIDAREAGKKLAARHQHTPPGKNT